MSQNFKFLVYTVQLAGSRHFINGIYVLLILSLTEEYNEHSAISSMKTSFNPNRDGGERFS